MFVLRRRAVWALGLSAVAACATPTSGPAGSDQAGASADGGVSGNAGRAGNAGSSSSGASGMAGSAGSSAGAATGGSSGTAGTGGSAAGSAGTAGSAGASAGSGGSAGKAGSGGTAGTAGNAGISGSAGTAGTSGTAGTAGSAGAGGTAGTGGTAGSAGASAGAGGGGTCTPATLTLVATSDSNLNAAAPTTNYGIVAEAHILRGGAAASQRALFSFDLTSLPAGKTLKTAKLQLTIVNNPGQNKTLAAHRVTQSPTRPWMETEVTWQAYKAGSNWTTAGGDFMATASDSQLVSDTAAVGAMISFDVFADAQSFYATPATNFGWLIKDSQEPASATGENVFLATRDTGTVDYKPKLVITYCP